MLNLETKFKNDATCWAMKWMSPSNFGIYSSYFRGNSFRYLGISVTSKEGYNTWNGHVAIFFHLKQINMKSASTCWLYLIPRCGFSKVGLQMPSKLLSVLTSTYNIILKNLQQTRASSLHGGHVSNISSNNNTHHINVVNLLNPGNGLYPRQWRQNFTSQTLSSWNKVLKLKCDIGGTKRDCPCHHTIPFHAFGQPSFGSRGASLE